METLPQREKPETLREKQDEEKEPVEQRGEEHPEEEEQVKRTISVPSLLPSMGSPPPSSSTTHQLSAHNGGDDSDSPPHPIDSPTNSSLSSGHSSVSRLSSLKDRSPLHDPVDEERNTRSPSPPAPVVSVKRSVRDDPPPLAAVVTKVDPAAVDGPAVRHWTAEAPVPTTMAGGGGGVGGGGGGRRLRPDLSILRRARKESMLRRVQLISRVCRCLFCLVAFAVMAADKDKGWAIDSFYRYKEFRFCLAVGAIGFVYSGLQASDLVYLSATGKHLARHHLRPYLDFSLDQIGSYLLISATSAAATRVEDWQMNYGKDKFPQMATSSVTLTGLAFISFAVSSVISFYMLCNLRSL